LVHYLMKTQTNAYSTHHIRVKHQNTHTVTDSTHKLGQVPSNTDLC